MDDAAQAKLDEFLAYTRERFPEQVDLEPYWASPNISFSTVPAEPPRDPNGGNYREFSNLHHVQAANRENPERRETLDDACADMRVKFDKYTEGRRGTLYWRVKPELDESKAHGWRYYLRFSISKPTKES